jgi:hypothetical protein
MRRDLRPVEEPEIILLLDFAAWMKVEEWMLRISTRLGCPPSRLGLRKSKSRDAMAEGLKS